MSRPFTGAWIETLTRTGLRIMLESRPFTGAWIETRHWRQGAGQGFVAPSRGRGLKLGKLDCANAIRQRRPFTGAWIETWLATVWAKPLNVAPSRGRGLKHSLEPCGRGLATSPLHGGVD